MGLLNLRIVSNHSLSTSRFYLQPMTRRKASRHHRRRTSMTNNFVLCWLHHCTCRRATSVSSFVFFSVVIQFHGLDCWRDRAGLTEPQKPVAGLGGSRSMEKHIPFFNFNVCSLVNTGRLQEIARTLKPDIAVLWNENSASSMKQLHGTTFGWIHCCALWLVTWQPHKSSNGCLHSLGQAFSTSNDQGSQFPSDFSGGTERSDAAERKYDGEGYPSVLLASFSWMQWCSTEGSTDGFSTFDNSSFELAERNSGVGRFRDGTQAEIHNASQDEAGDNFVGSHASADPPVLVLLALRMRRVGQD